MATPTEVAEALDQVWRGEELRAPQVPTLPVLRIESIRLVDETTRFTSAPYSDEPAARFEVRFTLGDKRGRWEFVHPIVDLERAPTAEQAAKYLGTISLWPRLGEWWSGTMPPREGDPVLIDVEHHDSATG